MYLYSYYIPSKVVAVTLVNYPPKFLSENFRHDGCWMHLSIPPIPMKTTLGASILYSEIIL
jgi:hypothetical protein